MVKNMLNLMKVNFATGSTPSFLQSKVLKLLKEIVNQQLENLQFVKLYQNAEEVIENLKTRASILNVLL